MNARKLAEALRKLQGHDAMTAQRVADCFGEAAAACEEEGEHEKNIAGHEHQIGQLEKTVKVYDVSLRAHAVLFDHHMERVAELEERLGNLWAAFAALPKPAPPPAPEERDGYMYVRPPAPSEQAQGLCAYILRNGSRCTMLHDSAFVLYENSHPWTPPEQARRWEGVCRIDFVSAEHGAAIQNLPGITVVQLRPGERIVSGEEVRVGVLVHKHTYTDSIWCEGRTCEPGIVVGIVYEWNPDAPPRAEGE